MAAFSPEAPDAAKLHGPLSRLLRPLVRLLIRSNVTFPTLCDLLRELYVNVAEYDFALPDKEQTDSRVSLLTGVHRKEVRRLRGAGAPVSTVPAALSRTSRIIARWIGAPEFADETGQPRRLPRVADAGPSFEGLVASVTRDVRPRAVLDEWLDRKIVVLDDQDHVVLTEAAFLPQGDDQQLYYFGRNLHDHVAGAVSNIIGAKPRFFERAVHYDGLPKAIMEVLESGSRKLATRALEAANRDAHRACEGADDGDWRWSFGIYIYTEDTRQQRVAQATTEGAAPESRS